MPARGEETAPIFDKLKPHELPRFFDELEYLFVRAAITSEADKKRHTLRYADFDIELLWRAIPEFADPTKTYDEFKAAILNFYPEASEDNRYSFSDVDILIGERLRLGINSVNELADFNMRFLATTNWLIDRGQFSGFEQRRSYIQAFPPSLLTSILTRLQIKFPGQHPDIPYEVSDVYITALFVLQSTPAPVYRNQYSLTDMDILIGERLRIGFYSPHELADFHVRFLAITNWLIERREISNLDQRRSYIQAFQPARLTSILTRLQNKFPDQHPDVPYMVSDVYEAAQSVWFVEFTSASVYQYSVPITPSSSPRQLSPPVPSA